MVNERSSTTAKQITKRKKSWQLTFNENDFHTTWGYFLVKIWNTNRKDERETCSDKHDHIDDENGDIIIIRLVPLLKQIDRVLHDL